MPGFLSLQNFGERNQSKPYNFTPLDIKNRMQIEINTHRFHSFIYEMVHIPNNSANNRVKASKPVKKLNLKKNICNLEKRENEGKGN